MNMLLFQLLFFCISIALSISRSSIAFYIECVCMGLVKAALTYTNMSASAQRGTICSSVIRSTTGLIGKFRSSLRLPEKNGVLVRYVCSQMRTHPEDQTLVKSVKKFGYRQHDRWAKAHRTHIDFQKLNKDWLQISVSFESTDSKGETSSLAAGGHLVKNFIEVTERTKRRKVENLRQLASAEELAFAAEMNFRRTGREDAAKVIHEVSQTSPTRPTKIRAAVNEKKPNVVSHTPEEALSLYIDMKSSQGNYQLLKNSANDHGAPKFFPSYKMVKQIMDQCIPPPNAIDISDQCAEVTLQTLLDHTASRLVELQREVIECILKSEGHREGEIEFILEGKYGFDGSSGQPNYKQNFDDPSSDDSSIFISSYVPLMLCVKTSGQIIWYNTKSSSSRFCRPIRLRFAKESQALILQEKERLDFELRSLKPTKFQIGSRQIKISHSLACSMIDGKVCGALTGISVQRCAVCGAYPREFHNLNLLEKRVPQTTFYEFGLSPLHFSIRCMECLIHISYRCDFKKTQARSQDEKILMRFRKNIIQEDFRLKMGLLLDFPKQGSGTTNDGNTARRFFDNPSETAAILNIHVELVTHISVLVKTLNAGFFINVLAFREFCKETYQLYLKHCHWYTMPPTLHRILFHGADTIEQSQLKGLPISALSEEPQETRNGDLKDFRRDRARKALRVQTNTDVFCRLMVTSDPKISSMRRSAPVKRRREGLPQQVLRLLTDNIEK